MKKICIICKKRFTPGNSARMCNRCYGKKYYKKNKEKINMHQKKYYKVNKEKISMYKKEYQQRPEVKERMRKYNKEYKKTLFKSYKNNKGYILRHIREIKDDMKILKHRLVILEKMKKEWL